MRVPSLSLPENTPSQPSVIDVETGARVTASDTAAAPIALPIVIAPPVAYRTGYSGYLRTAGISQVAALAARGSHACGSSPAFGGLAGFRQAKAGHAVHTGGAARFVN